MRIDINTKGKKIKDQDVRALVILLFGMDKTTPKMIKANLQYIADKYGYKIVPKDLT